MVLTILRNDNAGGTFQFDQIDPEIVLTVSINRCLHDTTVVLCNSRLRHAECNACFLGLPVGDARE